jgi:hypothetical protein
MLEALQPVVIDEAAWIVIDPARGTLFDVDERSDLDPT